MKRAIVLAACILCTASAGAKGVKIVRNSPALQFTYEWPAQAAAIPALDRRFRAEAAKEYRRHLALGREDKKGYRDEGRGSISDFYSKQWSTAGETARLLSLQYVHGTYTGGAHPNTDYGALLWERRLNREIAVSALFVQDAAFERLTRGAYCNALDRERKKRRGADANAALAEFNSCPKYSELAITPVDRDRDGRFDAVDFVASPYTAGPYVEGKYDVAVPVTAAIIRALKPQYRSSFEVQRQ